MLTVRIHDLDYHCDEQEKWHGPRKNVLWALQWALDDARRHVSAGSDAYPERTQLEAARSRYPSLELITMAPPPRHVPGVVY
jgi:hypothetical protein